MLSCQRWHRRADHPSARSRFRSRFLLTRWGGLTSPPTCGCSSTAEHLASNQRTAVRFRPAAPPGFLFFFTRVPFDFQYAPGVKGAARCFTVSPVQFRLPYAGVAQLVERCAPGAVSPVRVRPPVPGHRARGDVLVVVCIMTPRKDGGRDRTGFRHQLHRKRCSTMCSWRSQNAKGALDNG